MSWNSSLADAVDRELSGVFDKAYNLSEALHFFCNEVKNNRRFGEIHKTAVEIVDNFKATGYNPEKIYSDVVFGVVGKYFIDYVEKNAPRDFRYNNDEQKLVAAFKALVDEIEVAKNRGRQNSRNDNGWGGSNNNDWGGGSSRNSSPSFGSNSNNTNSGGNSWGNSNRGGNSLMSQATASGNTSTTTTTSSWGSQKVEEKPVQQAQQSQVQSSGPEFVIKALASIPYYILGKQQLAINNDSLKIVNLDEAGSMQFNYYKHELNTQFLEAHQRDGVLRPESHFEAAKSMLSAVKSPINGVESIKAEMEALNELLKLRREVAGEDVDLKVRRAVKFSEPREATTLSEAQMEILHLLGEEGFKPEELYAEFSLDRVTPLYATESDFELLSKFSDCGNLIQYGKHLLDIRGKVSDKVWYLFEHRLTKALNAYLGSTLPMFVELDSFINDYEALHNVMLEKFDSKEYPPSLQLQIVTDLTKYLSDVVGTFEIAELVKTTVEGEPNDQNDALRNAFAENVKEYKRLHNVVRENYLMVAFNAAQLRLAIPMLTDNQGRPKPVQPTGGIVDDFQMSQLHESLKVLMADKDEGITYLLTNDNFLCRVSRSLLHDGLFVLDLPIPVSL